MLYLSFDLHNPCMKSDPDKAFRSRFGTSGSQQFCPRGMQVMFCEQT